jgi:hypothetical protein
MYLPSQLESTPTVCTTTVVVKVDKVKGLASLPS